MRWLLEAAVHSPGLLSWLLINMTEVKMEETGLRWPGRCWGAAYCNPQLRQAAKGHPQPQSPLREGWAGRAVPRLCSSFTPAP